MSADPAPIDALRALMAKLRAPDGCPWDREQTHTTLREALLEEAYEVIAAIEAGDDTNLCEELGDLLLQVVFHSQLAAEQQRFDFDDVASAITNKLIRRHPHVFGDARCADSAAVLSRWEEIKRLERGPVAASELDGVAPGLPALMRAQRVQKKAARVGFDWDEAAPVIAKVLEELGELEAAQDDAKEREEEFGDLLFAVVNLGRKLRVDAEVALQNATDKFVARFRKVEGLANDRHLVLDKLTLAELDALWEEVKRRQVAELAGD